MIIKRLTISNFRSYYGNNNNFEFSDRLTLILGDNGDGKTTLYEALAWLFETSRDINSLDNVSEKLKSELGVGEKGTVSVSIDFEHDGSKSVEKYFSIERLETGRFRVDNIKYKAFESKGNERSMTDGKQLINRCYDAFIQRYSMFKGESDLNVFKGHSALNELVNKFSDIKQFDTLVEYTNSFEEKSNKAYIKEMKMDNKLSRIASELESEIQYNKVQIGNLKDDIKQEQNSIDTYSSKLNDIENLQKTSELFNDLKKRIEDKEKKKATLNAQINKVNYNYSLLDKFWVLCAFPPVLKDFQSKCSSLSKTKRIQERQFDREQAANKAKAEQLREIQQTLTNGSPELPWYLPDQETMEEMINEHICKVCGRAAEEGSDAYNYMVHRLEQYKAKLAANVKPGEDNTEEKVLFKNNYIEQLHNLSISLSGYEANNIAHIASDIKNRFELVERLKGELKILEDSLTKLKDEKTRLLIQAGNVPESTLEKSYDDIKGFFSGRERAQIRLNELTNQLKVKSAELNDLINQLNELQPEQSNAYLYKEIHNILNIIHKAFENARNNNLHIFLNDLEERANSYMNQLSLNDFHGQIRFITRADETTEIKLFSSNGSEVVNPSGSQNTVMYISILFAISDFTQEKRDEDYPLIFDAATSSFGDSKEKEFYNIVHKLNKQCIIVTKDFISNGKVREEDIEGLECTVYRIKKADGFDQRDMSTIRTTIEKIK